jgi:hypothetical protein
MNDLDLISEVKIEASSSGVAETNAQVNQLADGVEGLIVAQDGLSKAQIRVNAALEATAKKYDAEYRALTELSKAVNLLERARSQGLQGTEAYARIQDNVTLKLQAQANAARLANAEQQRLSATIRGQAQASINSVTGVKLDFDTDTRAADIAAYGAELDRLREKFVPLYALSQQFARSQKEVADVLAVGAISTNEAAAAQLRLTRAYEDSTQQMERLDRTRKESAQRSVNSQLIVPDRGGDVQAYGSELDRLQAKYDPLFAAQQRYKAGLDELRQTFAVGSISQDVFSRNLAEQKAAFAEQVNALGLYSQAQRNAAAAAAELAQAQTNAANKAKAQAAVNAQSTPGYSQADAEAFAKAAQDAEERLNPLLQAQRLYQAELRQIATDQKVVGASTETLNAANARATARYNNQIVEIKKAEEANARLAKGVGLNAYAWQNLSFQVNDVVTSLASGISPFQTLAQQGGQIYQILQTSQGGVGGALKAIAERLAAINPLVGVFAVLAAGAALAAVALNNFAKAQRDVELALLGAGRGAGLSADQIQKIAEQASATSTITVSAARDIEKAFLESGKVYGEVFAQGITAADDFAKKTGSKPVEAAKLLADALSDLGGGGFDELAKRAGNFDAAFEKTVKDAINRGNDLEAQRLVVERFGQAFDKAGEKATGLQSVLQRVDQGVKNAAESFGKAVSQRINGPSLSDQLEEATRARDVVIKAQKAADVVPDTSAQDEKIRKITAALKEQTVAVQKQAEVVRNNADARDQSGTTALVPAVASFKSLETAAAKANKELSSLEAQQKNGTYVPVDRIAAAKEAVAGAAAGLRDYASSQSGATMEMDKAKKVLAANMQALQAVTPEQKAAAASAKVLAEAYGTAESGTRRSREASDAYNKVMAESRQQTINTNRAQTESADASSRVADANTKTGNSVAFLTAQNKALAEAKAGTISQDEVENRTKVILREQLQAENQSRSEAIRAARDQTAVQQALNDKVAAQKMTAQEAQRRQANDIELSKLQREADAAQGEEKGALTVRLGELTTAYEAQISAEKRTQVLTMSEESSRQIEQLEKEGELLGLNNRERAIELAALQAKQNLQRQGISVDAPESVEYINKEKLKADLTYAKDQYTRMSQDITSALGGIFDDMTGAGKKNLTTFFDSFSKGFSKIGTRMLEQNLIGPLVNGGLDGKSGGDSIFDKLGSQISSIFGGGGSAEKAIAGGSEKGIFSGITNLFSGQKNGASNGGFAKSGLGSLLAPAAIGGSIGYSSQSPVVGALGGALTGFATGGIVGGLVGGAAGILGGLFGESQAKKQAKKQLQQELQARRDAYEQAKPQIEALDRTFLGESIGAVGAKILDAETQLKQAAKTASDAGDTAKANKLVEDFKSYTARLQVVFSDQFEGTLAGVAAGFGPDGPFASAASAVQQLGESLKAFVTDASKLPDPQNGQRARAAAVQGALSSLDPTPELSETQTQIQKINGTAAGLTQVLKDLGLSADQAATAIKDRTNKALDALAAKFNSDLDRKINDAQGKDYLNDAADLMKEVASLNADAAALGQDNGKVDTYFSAAAQKIVDNSQLVGDAFNELIAAFPELAGKVHAYTEDSKKSAEEMAKAAADALSAIQDRKRAYEDRAFAVNFSDNSLQTKLTAFERSAEWERWTEGAKGNQAIDELIATQDLERQKLIYDYNQAVQERRVGYQDRGFAANNNTATLGGQLAAFERQAQKDRQAEMLAGGNAIRDLTAAQEAERAKIIRDYYEAVNNRIRGFQDRTFAATNDENTLGGKLAAFQRTAAQQQIEEAKVGGEAMAALLQAQGAEQQKIINDYYKAVRDRQVSYQDRFFSATNNSNTLAGQLAAFERQAEKDRLAEVQVGGEAMADLTRAQEAERAKIIADYYDAVNQRILGFQDRLFAATNTVDLAGQLAAFDRSAAAERLAEIKSGGEALTALMQAQNAERQKLIDEYNKAIADRRVGYQDRAFTANGDNSLAGQLAAFERTAQKDRAEEIRLGGEAINDLTIAQEAERAKIVRDYYDAVNGRIESNADRLFAATNDSTTLTGQLAAFDRKAAQERVAEAKAGGEAMASLEAAQQAERLKVIEDFNKQAKAAFDDFANTIKKFLDSLLTNSASPLSPEERLKAAQSQYDEQLKLAQGGDKTAMGDITTYAQTLIDASKAYYASSQGFQDTFNLIRDQLGKLPDQVGAQAFGYEAPATSSSTDAVMAALAAQAQYAVPMSGVGNDNPLAPAAPPRAATAGSQGSAGIITALKEIGAKLDALRGDVQTGNDIDEEGLMQTIGAIKDVGSTLSKSSRDESRREVA